MLLAIYVANYQLIYFCSSAQASTYNCEMSDLDQSELKLGVHYAHTNDRDYWLFAWNPFDYTCRDKITTISSGNGNRVNHDRRMDIFREPGKNSTSSDKDTSSNFIILLPNQAINNTKNNHTTHHPSKHSTTTTHDNSNDSDTHPKAQQQKQDQAHDHDQQTE